MVHKGEMIVPADIAQLVRSGFSNPREGMDGPQISGIAQVSPSGGQEWSDDTALAMKSMMKGTLGTYAPYAAQGVSLFSQGKISANDLFSGLLDPGAIMSSVFSGGIPTMVNEELGMRSSSWGKAGQGILGFLGGMALGPAGSIIGGILGGIIGMAAGDALDARSYEDFRDSWEKYNQDKKGLLAGWFSAQPDLAKAIRDVENAHGPVPDINDPIGYDVDYGPASPAGGTNSASPGSAFGGPGVNESGVAFGFRYGGLVDRLMVPQGEDGWAPLQLSEGIVSRKGMETLDRINAGSFGMDISLLVRDVRQLRAALRAANYENIQANKKTARFTEENHRRALATA